MKIRRAVFPVLNNMNGSRCLKPSRHTGNIVYRINTLINVYGRHGFRSFTSAGGFIYCYPTIIKCRGLKRLNADNFISIPFIGEDPATFEIYSLPGCLSFDVSHGNERNKLTVRE